MENRKFINVTQENQKERENKTKHKKFRRVKNQKRVGNYIYAYNRSIF